MKHPAPLQLVVVVAGFGIVANGATSQIKSNGTITIIAATDIGRAIGI